MSHTTLGRWSVKLIIVFFALIILVQIIAAVGRSQGAFDSSSLNVFQLLMPIIIIPAGVCGVAAFVTGIISIIKSKERSVFVFFSTAIGLFVLLFVLGEFLFPH
jgi:cytochrome bd-type quinol oxidase subunit 2